MTTYIYKLYKPVTIMTIMTSEQLITNYTDQWPDHEKQY